MKFHKLAATAIATMLLAACGASEGGVETQDDSSLQSLLGFPCQSYPGNVVAQERKCLFLKGSGGRHPDTEILLDLQGFTGPQLTKVKQAADLFAAHWNQRVDQERNGGKSDFTRCMEVKATADLFGARSAWPAEHRGQTQAIAWAVLNVTYMFEHHASAKTPILVKAGNFGPDVLGKVDDFGLDGNNNTPGTINLNRDTLDDPNISAKVFSGTFLHEWLHRKDYRHPGTNLSSLIYAAGNCVRNDNNSGAFLTGGREWRDD